MTSLQRLEDYLDDQTWWQKTYWPIYRFFYWHGPRALYTEAKYFIQRGRRGYSDRDLWNADGHIARTVIAFIDGSGTFGGVPGAVVREGESHEKSLARWREIKAEIRWLMQEDLENEFGRWSDPEYRKRVDRANWLFGKYWTSLWD